MLSLLTSIDSCISHRKCLASAIGPARTGTMLGGDTPDCWEIRGGLWSAKCERY